MMDSRLFCRYVYLSAFCIARRAPQCTDAVWLYLYFSVSASSSRL